MMIKQFQRVAFVLCAATMLFSCSSDNEGLFENKTASSSVTAPAGCKIGGTIRSLQGDGAGTGTPQMRTRALHVDVEADIPTILKSSDFKAHCFIRRAGTNAINHTEVKMNLQINDDGSYQLYVAHPEDVFKNAVGRNPNPGEEWEMAIVAGGGEWDEASKRLTFSIDGNEGVASAGKNELIAPFACDWTKAKAELDGTYKVDNLDFRVRGTLVRLGVDNELTSAFTRNILFSSNALYRDIYFDLSETTADDKLKWKPTAEISRTTVVTNAPVPVGKTTYFVFWGMPAEDQTIPADELTPDAYGFTFFNKNDREVFLRQEKFKENQVTNLNLRIARPKLPIEYFAKENYKGHSRYAFTNTSVNDQSYYVYNRALDILKDLEKNSTDWHVPSLYEWAAVVPRTHTYPEETNSYPLIYLDGESKHTDLIWQNEEVECPRYAFNTYRSAYLNTRTGVNYALRFAPATGKTRWRSADGYFAIFKKEPVPFARDYSRYAAYRYEILDNIGNGHRGLRVSVRYLGEGGKYISINDIDDAFWAQPAPSGEKDIVVDFPYYGYMDQGIANRKVKQQEDAAYYWTVTGSGSLIPKGGWLTFITNARSISLRKEKLNETNDGRQYRYLLRLVSNK